MFTIGVVFGLALAVVLALLAWPVALWTNTQYVLLALNQPRKATRLVGVQAVATVVFLALFLLLKVPNGVGWAMLCATFAAMVPNLWMSRSELDLSLARVFLGLWRPVLGSSVMAVAVVSLREGFGAPATVLDEVGALAACVAVGAATDCSVVLAAWQRSARRAGAERYLLHAASKVLLRLGLRTA